jgi:hypothetical protein
MIIKEEINNVIEEIEIAINRATFNDEPINVIIEKLNNEEYIGDGVMFQGILSDSNNICIEEDDIICISRQREIKYIKSDLIYLINELKKSPKYQTLKYDTIK